MRRDVAEFLLYAREHVELESSALFKVLRSEVWSMKTDGQTLKTRFIGALKRVALTNARVQRKKGPP